jgi:hypothetical protein
MALINWLALRRSYDGVGHELPSAAYRRTNPRVAFTNGGLVSTRTGNVQTARRKRNPRQGRRQGYITDSSHWVSYLRPDGALFSNEMGRKWTGTWKIQNNKLCMSNPNLESLDCNEVWMSGANIRLPTNKDAETFDALVENHRPN